MQDVAFIYLFCSLIAGILIGSVGIGGVILVPALYYLAGVEIYQGIAAAMLAFIISGTFGTFIYSRNQLIEWSSSAYLILGALPGAMVGSFILIHIDPTVLKILIAILIVFSALRELVTQKNENSDVINGAVMSKKISLVIGFFTGVLSALSGTGGPLILIPVLMWFGTTAALSVSLSQVIQVPISVVASLGNYSNGLIVWDISIWTGVGVALGSIVGASLAPKLPVYILKKTIAILLLSAGFLMLSSIVA